MRKGERADSLRDVIKLMVTFRNFAKQNKKFENIYKEKCKYFNWMSVEVVITSHPLLCYTICVKEYFP